MSNEVDPEKLEALTGKVLGDVAGAMGLFLAYLGDRAGVYEALDEAGPITAEALAERTGLNPKYLREWLGSNAAGGYVEYDAETERFHLTPEQALVFTREGQPACMQGFFQAIVGQMATHEEAVETFVSGQGRPWSGQSACCCSAVDRFFRPGYAAHLVQEWLPAISGAREKLEAGARVADVGCGYGSATILLAEAFPRSRFFGFDFHEPSIEEARARARAAGVDNVEFHVARAGDFAGEGFDLVCIFDALHDMGDPVGAAAHVRETLRPDAAVLLVEPMAGDSLAENLHPLGQLYYGFSTTVCTPCSLAQEVGLGLGTQAGQGRLTEVLNEAGFSQVRRAAETPTNMVLEARI